MQLAFLMPSDLEGRKIETAQETIWEMRPDQIVYLEHLLRSWRVFGRPDGISLSWRAIKRTLRERP